MRKTLTTIVFLAICPLLPAQQTLNNDSVIKMVKMGFQEDMIVNAINRSPGAYDTSANGLIALKNAGVGSKATSAIVSKASAIGPTQPTQTPPAPGAQVGEPSTVLSSAPPLASSVHREAAPTEQAAGMPRKQLYTYQSGILQSFYMEKTGKDCSSDADTNGTVNASTDDSGTTNGTVHATTTGTTTCHDTQRAIYTVKVAENILVLTPALSGKGEATALMTLGWSRVFAKNSVLAYQLPGASLQIRSDGKHYFVKMGDRESIYSIIGAQ